MKVFLLREHMRACGLENATAAPQDPGAALPSETLRQLESLVEQISAISMRAARVEGVDVWRMVHKTAPQTGCPPGCACFVCRQREVMHVWLAVIN